MSKKVVSSDTNVHGNYEKSSNSIATDPSNNSTIINYNYNPNTSQIIHYNPHKNPPLNRVVVKNESELTKLLSKKSRILRLVKICRVMIIIELFITIISVATIIVTCLGIQATRNFNAGYCFCYAFFLVLFIGSKVLLMVLLPVTSLIIIFSILVVYETALFMVIVALGVNLSGLDQRFRAVLVVENVRNTDCC